MLPVHIFHNQLLEFHPIHTVNKHRICTLYA